MKFLINFLILQIIGNSFTLIAAQWCVSFRSVIKTRVQWNNGQRMVSKRNFFGGIKYKYEPYVYSTVQNYHDYERVTVCCDGYNKISDTKCEPICIPLCPINTHCIRPNICECDEQYRGYTAGANTIQCEPICAPGCSKNAQCFEPNKCSCNHGYEDNGEGDCQPICKKCPDNASCFQPEQCLCNTGYLDNGLGQCKPVCSKECPENSKCTAPEICSCHQNYEMKEDKCWPICEQECPENSECLRPNECVCKEGYEKAEELVNSNFKCLAKCDKSCPTNAECTQPNVCECLKGYKNSQDNLCEPMCENECPLHSKCGEPNHCICSNGYEMLDHHCQPICEKDCPEHSNCSEPNKCLCAPGYQLKLSSTYNLYCEPLCQSNCSTNGKCVQPNKCECLEGYEMDEMEVCQPVCSRGCNNGLCFQPDVCICKPGYLMGPQEECEPACSMPCQNGSCVEPEICQCQEGFKFKDNSVNICEPTCKPKCINGICVDPNVCICHENYEPTSTTKGRLNHSNCQLVETTAIGRPIENEETTTILNKITKKESKTPTEMITNTTAADFPTTNPSITLHTDHLRQISRSPFVSANICNERCQCWQEFDEFGPLIAKQCTHLCVDDFDKPCLDLNRCQCDEAKNHLVCHTSDDSLEQDDDFLYYMCSLQRFKSLDSGTSSDMKSMQPGDKSNFQWWWPVAVGVLVVICITGGLLYVRCKKVEDPIMEYEL